MAATAPTVVDAVAGFAITGSICGAAATAAIAAVSIPLCFAASKAIFVACFLVGALCTAELVARNLELPTVSSSLAQTLCASAFFNLSSFTCLIL